jgi:hypothetical protein
MSSYKSNGFCLLVFGLASLALSPDITPAVAVAGLISSRPWELGWHFAPGANLATLNNYGKVPALVRPLTRPTSPVPAFADGFAIDSDQMITVVGSTNALASSLHGYFEALLSAAWPQHKVNMRNIAWQADTV